MRAHACECEKTEEDFKQDIESILREQFMNENVTNATKIEQQVKKELENAERVRKEEQTKALRSEEVEFEQHFEKGNSSLNK